MLKASPVQMLEFVLQHEYFSQVKSNKNSEQYIRCRQNNSVIYLFQRKYVNKN